MLREPHLSDVLACSCCPPTPDSSPLSPHITGGVAQAAERPLFLLQGPAKKKLGVQQKKKAKISKSETYKIYSEPSANRPTCCLCPPAFRQ